MTNLAISGTGLYTPEHAISNEALVSVYNEWAEKYNAEHASEIEAGTLQEKPLSSAEFIESVSGIKQRYLMDTKGPLDVNLMRPELCDLAEPEIDGQPVMVKMMMAAAEKALAEAGIDGSEIDLVISASSTSERVTPAMSAEILDLIGGTGFAFDMASACSSATFGISTASDAILSGMANKALVLTCEYLSPFMSYTDRDSHFIFGDACVAMVIEKVEGCKSDNAFKILSRKNFSKYSTNISAHFGSRVLLERDKIDDPRFRFLQNGRSVFKELVPMVVKLVQDHIASEGILIDEVKRMWLHQANINMNQFAARKLLGRDATQLEAPIVLDEYANTAGAGCIIAFDKYKSDLKPGDKGVICSFGAGYSIGSILVEKM